jgi:phosphatidylglycerophosphatase A
MNDPKKKIKLTNPWHLLAVGFGSGFAPLVPGTMGTAFAIFPYLLLAHLPFWVYVAVCLFSFWIGIHICQKTSDDMGVHDHGSIVWDEFVGLWITMLIIPFYGINPLDLKWLAAGFVLFRFFDMVKPWPIGWLDKRVHGGLGIMIDDVVAGIMAGIGLVCVGGLLNWL